jgi:hypothetical protein
MPASETKKNLGVNKANRQILRGRDKSLRCFHDKNQRTNRQEQLAFGDPDSVNPERK